MRFGNSLTHKIQRLRNLPLLPDALQEFFLACGLQHSKAMEEIPQVAQKYPLIGKKILQWINTSCFDIRHKVEDMRSAVELVGGRGIRNGAVITSMYDLLGESMGETVFNLRLFWWHSLRCALIAKRIAKGDAYRQPDVAFLCGFLHDIGKLVVWPNLPEEYAKRSVASSDQDALLVAGEMHLGVTHSEIGAWLLHEWDLEAFVVDAVLYHHEPRPRVINALSLVRILYVANGLSQASLEKQEEAKKTAIEMFGLSESDVEDLVNQADNELEEMAGLLGVEIEGPSVLGKPAPDHELKGAEDLSRKLKVACLLIKTLQNLTLASDQKEIFKAVQRGLRTMFEVELHLIFLHDPEKDRLVGRVITENDTLSENDDLNIPMQAEETMLIKSLHQGRPLHSFHRPPESPHAISDEQVVGFIGKEGMLCLPLTAAGEDVGVIVVGLDEAEFSRLSKHEDVLMMLSNHAALPLRLDLLQHHRFQTIRSESVKASSAIARKMLHEVNNPLSIIKNYLKILGMKLSKQNIAQDEIRIINEEIDRVALILKELASFSDTKVHPKEPVEVNALVSDLAKLTRESLQEDSKIVLLLDLEPSVPTVMADKNGLKQVFINLINNAIEAMPDGGNLTVRTRYITNLLDDHMEEAGQQYKGYLEITVIDEGAGIPEEMISRIFDPFVTSKERSHPGLGLSIVHNIIKALDGSIQCEQNPSGGTSFTIRLPVFS